MFQMAVGSKSTMKQAKECIAEALRYKILQIGEAPDVGCVIEIRELARDPSKHPRYLCIDNMNIPFLMVDHLHFA